MASVPSKEYLKYQILVMIARGPWRKKPLCKTRVINRMCGRYWFHGGGHVSGWFCCVAKLVTASMNELIEEGTIEYTPLKPLKVNYYA